MALPFFVQAKNQCPMTIAAFFKVLVASTIQLCRSFLGLLLPIRVQHHRPYWLPVTRLT